MHLEINENIPCIDRPNGLASGILIASGPKSIYLDPRIEVEGINSVDDASDSITLNNDVSDQFEGAGKQVSVNGLTLTISTISTVSDKTVLTFSGSPDLSSITNEMSIEYIYNATMLEIAIRVYETLEFANQMDRRKSGSVQIKQEGVSLRKVYKVELSPSQAEAGLTESSMYDTLKTLIEADGYAPANVVKVS